MAATRKLQGEIDRCLKKVAEGVETFEDIWKKVHNATNSNQKEKYEADLKKEIKKLQRLRDQIKSWIASGEIKDKSSLLENRRLIETQMERFKIVERETKTKAYSKEGLGAAQKMDPAQRVKDEARNWITNAISSLQIQIDQYESEVESLLAAKKKRLDRDKQDRMDDLRAKLDRHKFHVSKLETLLRLLDNDGVEAEKVNKIKDDVEYYIDSSQEPDFKEDEYIYDEIIGLEEVELSAVLLGILSSATTDSNNSNETSGSPSSITSGGSPIQSPQPAQQQQQQTSSAQLQPQQQQLTASSLNYSSDAAITDAVITSTAAVAPTASVSSAEKRIKIDSVSTSKTKQPVKPTAIRAASSTSSSKAASGSATTSDATTNKLISSTPSKNHQQPTAAAVVAAAMAQQQQQQQQQQHTASSLSSVIGGPTLAAAIAALNESAAVQQHAPAPSLSTSVASVVAGGTTAGAAATTAAPSSNIQGQTVIQATPAIAFSAVAKNSTSLLENGPVHPPTSYAMAVPTVASIVGSSAQQQQQQQHQLPNLQTNSLHMQNGLPAAVVSNNANNNNSSNNNSAVDTISLKTMAQEAINRSVIDTNSLTMSGPNIDSRQQQQQQQLLQQHFSTDSTASQQQQTNTAAPGIPTTNGPTSAAGVVGSSSSTNVLVGSSNVGIANLQNAATVQAAVSNATVSSSKQHPQQSQQQQQQLQQLPTNEAHIPPLLGVAPLGPSPLHKDHQIQFQMMEAAYYHLPTPLDSEKLTTYFHRKPVQTPPHYPQSQLPIYDTVEFYQRLSTETLFFVFYYMEGSKAQYLAAKALKKQSWRFHTKYMMWFQRHEEPKIINDDYEQGTYIYFDYERWSQRKKEGFTFEYKYLEDKELN